MINQDFDVLKNWMFGSLASLLDGKLHNSNLKILKMSIGEPQLGPPEFIKDKFDIFFDDWEISSIRSNSKVKKCNKIIFK